MRRIFISDQILGYAITYKNVLQTVRTFTRLDKDGTPKNFYVKPLDRLKKLKTKFDNNQVLEEQPDPADNKKSIYVAIPDSANYADYIQKIIDLYPTDLLIMKPDRFNATNTIMMACLQSPDRLNTKLQIGGRKVAKPFHEILVDTMQYAEVRRWILPEHIRRVGVKTCVYCNANFTITSEEGHAFYDIDHWKPKAVYPWACLSFFNFQPACHTCNQLKNDDADDKYFGLYESDPDKCLDVLHFSLSSAGLVDFILNHESKGLDINLSPYNVADKPIADKQNSKLHINEIYKEHFDVIEETSWRKLITNESWIQSIEEGLKSIALDKKAINRLLYANYTDAEDVHKRPLSRLVQDIINMDFDDIEVAKAQRDSLLPQNIEVGDFFLLEDNSIVRIDRANHDFFDCSDNEVHSIDELKALEWYYLDFDNILADIQSRALSLSLDEMYGGNTPAHIVQNKIRTEFGFEMQLNQENIDASGLVVKM